MKLQYLAVIFVIIILPIVIVLSFYTQSRIDTMNLQSKYTSALNTATYDAINAFQRNTNNSYYSSVSDSKIRDIEASVNTFYNSLTVNLGYTKSEMQAFVPAIVYTLYDGYYIYGKRYNVLNNNNVGRKEEEGADKDEVKEYRIQDPEVGTDPDLYEYGLKPFVYYSCRYKIDSDNDFVVNFTLDNFISIYGKVDGKYVTKSGYLIDLKKCASIELNSNGEAIKVGTYKETTIAKEGKGTTEEYLRFNKQRDDIGIIDGTYPYIVYKSQKIYYIEQDSPIYFWFENGEAHLIEGSTSRSEIKKIIDDGITSAVDYYKDAYNFSKWVTDNLSEIKQSENEIVNGDKLEFNAGDKSIFDMSSQDPEDPSSTFNQHRIAVIKNAIETNLIAAINSYNNNAESYAYSIPKLSEEEWEKVVNNVCVISFMQGIPIGGKYYNNYSVFPNDFNNEFVDTDAIYLLTKDGQYHMPNCPDLVENKDYVDNIEGGYLNTSFARQSVKIDETEEYYYKHIHNNNTPYTACYNCIVIGNEKYKLEEILNNENNKIVDKDNNSYDITKLRQKYITILAREKYNLYKTNNWSSE